MSDATDKLLDTLRDCEAYFEERADAEYRADSAAPTGNEEMRLLVEVEVGLKLLAEAPQQIEAKPEDQARAKAEAWVDEFSGKLAETDVEGARTLFAKSANAIAKLEREHPDLHAAVVQLTPTEDAGPADEPNSETNDQATEPTPAEKSVADVIAKADAAATLPALQTIIKEAEQHKAFLSDDLQIKLEIAFDRNRNRLEPVELEPAK